MRNLHSYGAHCNQSVNKDYLKQILFKFYEIGSQKN